VSLAEPPSGTDSPSIPTTPVVQLPIRLRTPADRERFWVGVRALGSEDSSFSASTARDGQIVLAGMGELHLQIIVDRLRREFDVSALTGSAEVAYRQAITKEADGEGSYGTHAEGTGRYARTRIRVSPTRAGEGYVFVTRAGAEITDAVARMVDEGIRRVALNGGLSDRVDDLLVELREVSFAGITESHEALKISGELAFRDAVKRANRRMLEPIMLVAVDVADSLSTDVVEELKRRGAEWQSDEVRGATRIILVRARMSQMLGFSTVFRQKTDGRGSHSMRLEGYRQVP
jgi:elongation factor G